jgi:hypothetical protein
VVNVVLQPLPIDQVRQIQRIDSQLVNLLAIRVEVDLARRLNHFGCDVSASAFDEPSCAALQQRDQHRQRQSLLHDQVLQQRHRVRACCCLREDVADGEAVPAGHG